MMESAEKSAHHIQVINALIIRTAFLLTVEACRIITCARSSYLILFHISVSISYPRCYPFTVPNDFHWPHEVMVLSLQLVIGGISYRAAAFTQNSHISQHKNSLFPLQVTSVCVFIFRTPLIESVSNEGWVYSFIDTIGQARFRVWDIMECSLIQYSGNGQSRCIISKLASSSSSS